MLQSATKPEFNESLSRIFGKARLGKLTFDNELKSVITDTMFNRAFPAKQKIEAVKSITSHLTGEDRVKALMHAMSTVASITQMHGKLAKATFAAIATLEDGWVQSEHLKKLHNHHAVTIKTDYILEAITKVSGQDKSDLAMLWATIFHHDQDKRHFLVKVAAEHNTDPSPSKMLEFADLATSGSDFETECLSSVLEACKGMEAEERFTYAIRLVRLGGSTEDVALQMAFETVPDLVDPIQALLAIAKRTSQDSEMQLAALHQAYAKAENATADVAFSTYIKILSIATELSPLSDATVEKAHRLAQTFTSPDNHSATLLLLGALPHDYANSDALYTTALNNLRTLPRDYVGMAGALLLEKIPEGHETAIAIEKLVRERAQEKPLSLAAFTEKMNGLHTPGAIIPFTFDV